MERMKMFLKQTNSLPVEPKGLPGSQYPSATAVECCEGENGMAEPKGLPGSQYPTDTVVECCEGENGMVEPKGLPGSQYPTDTVVECCEGENGMLRIVKCKKSALALVCCGILCVIIALGYLLFRRIKKKVKIRNRKKAILVIHTVDNLLYKRAPLGYTAQLLDFGLSP
ncbi:hypothetical protein T4D_10158 [Trichinella pseudospiralis]|uniref:Uncharacterized protein n=1 Tax=Trichinella pseudospiralis TaxID=6337 RepID=A0A0V1FWA1_TRIPS|nr:hypothetical protein T4D_10158 [Trichinella pseudospiralis]